MIKKINVIILLVFLSPGVYCDSPVLQSYIQRFSSADLLGKADILREVSSNASLGQYSGQFYEHALRFVLDNHAQMSNIREMNNIVNVSINGLRDSGCVENLDILWRLFLAYPNSEAGAEILITLGILGKGNRDVIDNINFYLMERNLQVRSGRSVDYVKVSACISAIMEMGDSSSYPVLFSSICAGYPEVIASEAYGALELIPGNLNLFLLNVIGNNPPEEKFAAFRTGINSRRLNLPERGQLAELALEQSLAVDEESVDLTAMSYAAVQTLTSLRWTRANALAIRHYYRVQANFLYGTAPKERFIEAIACMGAVGNSEAALVLGLQLGLINGRMERTGSFDEEITLAIVQSLGLIGDKAVFDHLLNVINLPYPENIHAAAREAIDRLKW